MNSHKELLDMIATEATEGSQDHHFDEAKNKTPARNYEPKPKEPQQPQFYFPLRVVRLPDGSLDWTD